MDEIRSEILCMAPIENGSWVGLQTQQEPPVASIIHLEACCYKLASYLAGGSARPESAKAISNSW